ncbi:MAG: DUF5658 family protein [Pseudomonadota bacterium]
MEITVDRRTNDRRQGSSFLNTYQLGIGGRRRTGRRASDMTVTHPDHYSVSIILCALAVVLMSALDAAFTLTLINNGAIELNAVMAFLIETDIRKFVIFKLGLTSLAVFLFVIHHGSPLAGRLRVGHLHYATIAGYIVLMGYELWLLRLVLA